MYNRCNMYLYIHMCTYCVFAYCVVYVRGMYLYVCVCTYSICGMYVRMHINVQYCMCPRDVHIITQCVCTYFVSCVSSLSV